MNILVIPVQSFSDVITNSSSEIFCTISGTDLDAIYELLFPAGYSDMEPTLYKEDDSVAPTEFYKAGLEAILDKYFKDNYKIEYE